MNFLSNHINNLERDFEFSTIIMKYMNIYRIKEIFNNCPNLKNHFLIKNKNNKNFIAYLALLNETYLKKKCNDNVNEVMIEINTYLKKRSETRPLESYNNQLPNDIYDLLI